MRHASNTVFAFMFLVLGIDIAWASPGNDTLWETTMTMDGMGMPGGMGMPSQKICTRASEGKTTVDPKDAMKGQKNCTMSDVKTFGNKATWNFKCTGEHPMTGTAEVSGNQNEYTMKMKTHMAEGDMNMTTVGKKIGTCNYDTDSMEAQFCGSMNKNMADAKKDQAEKCKKDLDSNNYDSFLKQDTAGSIAVSK